jgi:uncharacterized protein YqgC (DUF456 family)
MATLTAIRAAAILFRLIMAMVLIIVLPDRYGIVFLYNPIVKDTRGQRAMYVTIVIMSNVILIVICSLLMVVGLFGIILPFIPGVPLVWLGLLIYAIATGFETVSILAVVIFFVLTVLTLVFDLVAPLVGLKKYRASNWSLLGAFLGFIVGIIFFNIWGVILGPIVGAFIAELIVRKDVNESLRAALAAFLGSVVGALIKILIALIMIGYFIYSFF